jgi:hypothetical protein
MSRHRTYRNYDYQVELDDFDASDYEDTAEGGLEVLSLEDQQRLRDSREAVLRVLGGSANSIPVKEIDDTLYYYYFDVDQSVQYLRENFKPRTPKKPVETNSKGEPSPMWTKYIMSHFAYVLFVLSKTSPAKRGGLRPSKSRAKWRAF